MLENALHAILRRQFPGGEPHVTYPSGRRETYGDGSGTPLALRFADTGALRAVFLDPSLAVPEMYMDGRLVIEAGNVYELIALAKTNTRPEVSTPVAWAYHAARRLTRAPIFAPVGLAPPAPTSRTTTTSTSGSTGPSSTATCSTPAPTQSTPASASTRPSSPRSG